MMKYLKEYNNAIARYRAGEFGHNNISLHDIMVHAGDPELMNKLSISELNCLLTSASGVTKNLFARLAQKEEERIASMERLEKELVEFGIDSYRTAGNDSDEVLAQNLNLFVEYCGEKDLPKDTEALLCPTDNASYFGVIKILKDRATTKFSFRHELIHYFRDVKIGNRVTVEFARNSKGNTPNNEEQEINYLTAASIMPFEDIKTRLNEFEKTVSEAEEQFLLADLSMQYGQSKDAILRRLIEVRSMVDFAASKS